MQSIHKQTGQSDVRIAVKKATSVGAVGIRNSNVDHQGVMVDPGFKTNNKTSRETRTLFA